MIDTSHYLSLNYHKRLYQDEDGDWIAEVDDLPGCVADGKTPDEAIKNLRDAMTSWIGSRLDAGLEVPEPSVAEEYSGKILVRMPRFLHRRLALQAKAEAVSLNQYLVSLLVDASTRANLASQTITPKTLGTCLPCSYAGPSALYQLGYIGNVAFGDPNPSDFNNWGGQEFFAAYGGSPLLGRGATKLLPALSAQKETA